MNKPKLAVIIPCYNEELCIESTTKKLFEVINYLVQKDKISKESFIYFIDDGSTDSTWQIIEKLHKENPLVKAQKFIRNYGNQKALIAGLQAAENLNCDCVVSIDADLQQDEWAIEKFLDKFNEGYEVVSGIRNDRQTDTFFKKWFALMFYKTMNILGAKIPVNHSDYRLVSRKALRIMDSYPEKSLFLRGFFNELGLKTAYVNFDVKPRFAGVSKFNFMSLTGLALNGITSFSIVPLRFISVLGFFMMFFAFIAGLETVYEKIFCHNSPNGMATAIILLSIFGGIQMLCTGIIGEYIGQIYREVKSRPRYITDIELK